MPLLAPVFWAGTYRHHRKANTVPGIALHTQNALLDVGSAYQPFRESWGLRLNRGCFVDGAGGRGLQAHKHSCPKKNLHPFTAGISLRASAEALTKQDMKPSLMPCFFPKSSWYCFRIFIRLDMSHCDGREKQGRGGCNKH